MSWTNTHTQIITNNILGHYKDLRVYIDRQTYIQQFQKSNRKWNVESIYVYKNREGEVLNTFSGLLEMVIVMAATVGWLDGCVPEYFVQTNTHSHIPIKTYKCKFMHNLYTFHWSPNQKFKSFRCFFPNALKKNAPNSGGGWLNNVKHGNKHF